MGKKGRACSSRSLCTSIKKYMWLAGDIRFTVAKTGFGEEDLRTASGCSTTAPFDMELSPTQMLSPHKSSPLASQPVCSA